MKKLYAVNGQTQVHHDGKVYEVKNGVVEVDDSLVPLFTTLGFLASEKEAKEYLAEKAKEDKEKEDEEDNGKKTPAGGHHQHPAPKK